MKTLFSISLFFALSLTAFAQVPVAMAPPLHFQFFDANGVPLANGKIFTYAAGTTTPQNTYADAGGMSQNTNPILLDGSGSPSNGSVQTGVFLANSSYRFFALNSSNVFQWSVDNVTNYFGLLNSTNLWTGTNTFSQAVSITLSDNQMFFGSGNQSILDFPPAPAPTTFHVSLPQSGTTSDNIPTDTSTDSLGNKTLLNPLFNSSGCAIINGPGTYICVPNASPTGTSTGALTKLTGAPSAAIIAATTDISGIVGITVAGSGTTGNATIQQDGQVPCMFDGATTAGDYAGISATVAGDCTDAGTSPPVGSQNIGQVLSTNASAGTYPIVLSSPGSGSGIKFLCQNVTQTTVNASTTAAQTVLSCPVPSVFNAAGKIFRVTANMLVSTSTSTSFLDLFLNSGAGSPMFIGVAQSTSGTASYSVSFSITCSIVTPGSSGLMTCTGPIGGAVASGSTTLSLFNGSDAGGGGNLTGTSFTIGTSCSFGSASVSNSCQGNELFVEQLN